MLKSSMKWYWYYETIRKTKFKSHVASNSVKSLPCDTKHWQCFPSSPGTGSPKELTSHLGQQIPVPFPSKSGKSLCFRAAISWQETDFLHLLIVFKIVSKDSVRETSLRTMHRPSWGWSISISSPFPTLAFGFWKAGAELFRLSKMSRSPWEL